jgi:hypothetical protein
MDGKPAGACLGLAIAARLDCAIPAAVVALGILAWHGKWTEWVDRVLIPAVVVALIVLVLPLSHAHAASDSTPELSARQAAHLQSALDALRTAGGTNPIRIGATPAIEPAVNFFRAQHRSTTWDRASRNYQNEGFDYYVLPATGAGFAEQRHLIVLYRDADFLVARRS